MEFTGERFTTDCVREIWYEHWHRYAFARRLVAGKSVLDLACGEGYGSHLLAEVAAHVTGVDIATDAIDHARDRYQRDNLKYVRGEATAIPLPDDCVDVVVSFETLEHLEPQAQMLAEFQRVLRPDGFLLISTPDKRVYSDEAGFDNEYHVKELYREEFEALLSTRFPAFDMYGQKLLFQSVMWQLSGGHTPSAGCNTLGSDGRMAPQLTYEPLYLIAVAAAKSEYLPAAEMVQLHLFGDGDESVYTHYNHEIRKNMEAGTILLERDAEIAALRKKLAQVSVPWWRRLFGSD